MLRFILPVLFSLNFEVFADPHINDITYTFDSQKLETVKSDLSFFTTFVDYYYLLSRANRDQLEPLPKLGFKNGWCGGDLHPDNFGALIQKDGKSKFSVNDMDDSGPCPLIMDFERFLVAAKLLDSEINLEQLISSYSDGLNGKQTNVPPPVEKLLKKSDARGMTIDPDDLENGKLKRDERSREIDAETRDKIRKALEDVISEKFVISDIFQTAKVGGGSNGLPRYEILINNSIHLELKDQPAPSISPVSQERVPETRERIAKTLLLEQGTSASPFYQVAMFGNLDFLLRPKYFGNSSVKMNKLNPTEIREVLIYEAFTVGILHAKSIDDPKAWADLVSKENEPLKSSTQAVAKFISAKFISAKFNANKGK